MEDQFIGGPTDRDLLRRAKAGDFAAFQKLIFLLQPRVFGLSFRILQQVQDAEDATKQTFLALIEHIADFREESSLATWVLRIASNHALKILRKKRGLKMVSMSELGSDDSYSDLPHPEFIAPWSTGFQDRLQQSLRSRWEEKLASILSWAENRGLAPCG